MKKIVLFIMSMISFHITAQPFTLSSTDLSEHGFSKQYILNSFGCDGENISPNLQWHHSPKETKSFVLTMYDPDAPTGSGWWHWVIANIPATANHITHNAGDDILKLPNGAVAVRNDFGHVNYGGPCPPAGTNHRYIFTLYALDIETIDVNDTTSAAFIGYISYHHMLDKATLVYHYQR